MSRIPGVFIDPDSIQTNIVIIELTDGDPLGFLGKLEERGLRGSHPHGSRVRFVTHYGIEPEDIDAALDVVESVMKERVSVRR